LKQSSSTTTATTTSTRVTRGRSVCLATDEHQILFGLSDPIKLSCEPAGGQVQSIVDRSKCLFKKQSSCLRTAHDGEELGAEQEEDRHNRRLLLGYLKARYLTNA
jgi:hypothetical protein